VAVTQCGSGVASAGTAGIRPESVLAGGVGSGGGCGKFRRASALLANRRFTEHG
jgi:hypothetical protein